MFATVLTNFTILLRFTCLITRSALIKRSHLQEKLHKSSFQIDSIKMSDESPILNLEPFYRYQQLGLIEKHLALIYMKVLKPIAVDS